jgi:alkaline phosphatase D
MVTRRRMLQAAAMLPASESVAGFAAASPALSAAPIAGHFTHESVRLWLQTSSAATAIIVYWPENDKEENARRIDLKLIDNNACAAIASIRGLEANSRYRFTVLLDNVPTGLMRSFRTSPAPGSVATDFRVYLGSCAYTEAMSPNGNPYGDEFHIFDAMADAARSDRLPHFMLWLGDNLYFRPKGLFLAEADVASVSRMEARYRDVRSSSMFQKLFAATHHYAIWDDHDYGPNDSDKSFKYKDDALRLFKQYWPNPEMGSQSLPGTWTKFTHQDAEFFLLDDRTYRDAENAPPSESKTMFGAAQIAWLKKTLKESRAMFKIIANGSQLLSDHDNGHHSGWHSYQVERDAFLTWLAAEKIPGLVMLTGDRHNTQVFRLAQSGAPTVYEFSCSPLTSRLSKLDRRERTNPRLVKELVMEKRNFGTLEFSGVGMERKLIARCFDSHAKLLWEKLIASARISATGEPV